MSEWIKKSISEVCDIKHGYAFSGEHITTNEAPYILVTPGNFSIGGGFKISNNQKRYNSNDFPLSYILKEGDLIVTMTDLSQNGDTLGYAAIVPKTKSPCLHNQRIGLVENIRDIDSSLLYWIMRTNDYQASIVNSATGSTVKHTSPSRIGEYEFFVPADETEQRAIAEVLSSLDDKIDLLTRQNVTLEALAQTYFRQWFIENRNDVWEEKGLDEIADFLNGLALQNYPYKTGEPMFVIKIKELNNGYSDNSDICSPDIPEKYIVHTGDVVFSWSGSLTVDIWKYGKGGLNQHLFKVTSADYPKWFYYYWIKQHLTEFRAIAESKATTMGHIQRGHLSSAKVIVPTVPELEDMNKTMYPLIEKIERNNAQIITLQKLRDTLLPKLISGEVRVEY